MDQRLVLILAFPGCLPHCRRVWKSDPGPCRRSLVREPASKFRRLKLQHEPTALGADSSELQLQRGSSHPGCLLTPKTRRGIRVARTTR